MGYISKILYLPLKLAVWDIFLIDITFLAADIGFNCFKLLIKIKISHFEAIHGLF